MSRKGKAQTVLGLVDPGSLGVVLTHEHVSMDFSACFLPPKPPLKDKSEVPFTMRNLGWIRQNPYVHKENLRLWGDDIHIAVIEDVRLFKESGGGCIVENSTNGIRRNPEFFLELSKETGVHVVAGAGYYTNVAQSSSNLGLSLESITQTTVKELTEGIEGAPGVVCGVIGEVGTSWPLHDFERRSVQAAATAQESTGSPVIIHPGRDYRSPDEVMRIFTEAGGDASRTVMSHFDRTFYNLEDMLEFSKWKTYLEFDLFGIEVSHYAPEPQTYMPSDEQRIQYVKQLVQQGLEDKVVIAHDVHTKHRLVEYGGHGYSHINENIVPKMKHRGISEEVISKITKTNPQTWLTFSK